MNNPPQTNLQKTIAEIKAKPVEKVLKHSPAVKDLSVYFKQDKERSK